jgi:Holliday junction resolvase RusA-like endonuclease
MKLKDTKHKITTSILNVPIRVKSRNVLDREHWAVKRKDKQEYCLLIRNQMRINKIDFAKACKYKLTIISVRKRKLDYDNLVGGCKHLIDALIDERFIHDDSPEYIDLNISQVIGRDYRVFVSRDEIE